MPTILITGANTGIGFEFARQYSADGWSVIACCRKPGAATELRQLAEQRDTLRIERLDVTDHAAIDDLAARYRGEPIDILLNNAGIVGPYPLDDHIHRQHFGSMDYALWDDVLHTNTFGPLKMTEAFLEQVAASDHKKIVCISSSVGSITEVTIPALAYASSKTALNRVMTIVAKELKERGIIVALLCPGYTRTRMVPDSSAHYAIEPEISITGMRKIISALTLEDSGSFTRYNGDTVSW